MKVAVLQSVPAMEIAICHKDGLSNTVDLDSGPNEAGIFGDPILISTRELAVLGPLNDG